MTPSGLQGVQWYLTQFKTGLPQRVTIRTSEMQIVKHLPYTK